MVMGTAHTQLLLHPKHREFTLTFLFDAFGLGIKRIQIIWMNRNL